MKTITSITLAAVLFANATMTSSVGGPLTELFILILAMWAVGLYEVWSKKLGLLGGIAGVLLSFIGGAAGLMVGNMAMETALSLAHFQGSLANSNHPLFYILSAVMALLTVFGSWSAIQILIRLRPVKPEHRGT